MNYSTDDTKEYFVGIDLGTSSVKLVLIDGAGKTLASASEQYAVSCLHPGWSEQEPKEWLESTLCGLKKILENVDRSHVRGMGMTGQMNGLVILDENDQVIRPAILWNDGRTGKETEYLNSVIGKQKLMDHTGNIAFASFTAPKIMWVRDNEPQNYQRISKILLPKDYLIYRLTGRHVTDTSDASGSLLFDVKNRCWSAEICALTGAKREWLPEVHESGEAIGKINPEYERLLGLKDVTVAAGAGDNEAAALSTGTLKDGDCNISLGTSGTVFIATDEFKCDDRMILHSHAHVNGRWHLLGCVLSAASSCNWWVEHILKTDDYDAENEGIKNNLGKNAVFFLPYLTGDRMLNDVNARAVFIGMSSETERRDMFQAVMEGVGFGLRDCLEAAKALSIDISSAAVCGGGAKNRLWLEMIADILNIQIRIPMVGNGPCFGAALLSMVACGRCADAKEIANSSGVSAVIEPDREIAAAYDRQYAAYKLLYPALKGVYPSLLQKG